MNRFRLLKDINYGGMLLFKGSILTEDQWCILIGRDIEAGIELKYSSDKNWWEESLFNIGQEFMFGKQEDSNRTHHLDELPNVDKDVVLKMYNAAIPKLESKQETLEEAAERHYINCIPSDRHSFISGANWQAERMYSEEDMIRFMQYIISNPDLINSSAVSETTAKYYLEQFKKK